MASNTGHVMNLANSVIGVSLLAMPFCFKQCGITLAIIMLILSSIISRLACYFLMKSSTICRRRNFEFLAFYTFGPSGKLLVELGVIGFMMGTCVAFFVVMGDLGPAIISKIFNISNNSTLRTSVLTGLGLLVVLPLGLLKNVESLAAISAVTIAYYFLFILKIFMESSTHLVSGDWWAHVRFWQPEGILQCIPIFAMALSCQTQLFEIYNSLPSPSIDKMNSVVRSALNLCTVVYASVGLLGYIAYCKENFTGNIMMSFTPSLSSEMFKLGFVMSIAVSFPLVIFPCRASLFSLIFRRMPIHHELSQTSCHIPDSRYKCLTVAIVSVALITGLLIPSIELVLGFVGSTIGIAICVIFPSLSFLNLHNKSTNERVMAKITLLFGLLIMIMGTFGNLFAAVEHQPVRFPSDRIEDSKSLLQIKVPPKIETSTETAKKFNSHNNNNNNNNNNYSYKTGVALVNPFPPERLVPHKAAESVKPRIKVVENIRKEPPVPVAPPVGEKEKEKQRESKLLVEVVEKKKAGSDEKKGEALSVGRQNENINKDAIEKEEREMEVEKPKKTEEDAQQQEFLKKLKEHQDEQKKLLQEQEKILREMKSRESEKRLKEEPNNSGVVLKEVKTIKPEEFKANINRIQTVIENLKETKNILEKVKIAEKERNFVTEKPKVSDGGAKGVQVPEGERVGGVKKSMSSVPLPLAKLQLQPEAKGKGKGKEKAKAKEKSKEKEKEKEKEKSKVPEREKRDVDEDAGDEGDEGECVNGHNESQPDLLPLTNPNDKTERVPSGKPPASPNGSSAPIIRDSLHLTVHVTGANKLEITPVGPSKLVPHLENQPFISKKRDLKSVSTAAN